MKTLHKKFIYSSNILKISEPIKLKETGYPLPSNWLLDIKLDESHSITFGYDSYEEAIQDKAFLEKFKQNH